MNQTLRRAIGFHVHRCRNRRSLVLLSNQLCPEAGRTFFVARRGAATVKSNFWLRTALIGDRERRANDKPFLWSIGSPYVLSPRPTATALNLGMMPTHDGTCCRPAPFTKWWAEVPKQDGPKFGLLQRGVSASPAGRPERIAPFILTEAAQGPPFFGVPGMALMLEVQVLCGPAERNR